MTKPLTPMEREIDLAARSAYRDRIRALWGDRNADILDKAIDAERKALEDSK